ncbi:MAG: two-component system response regulator [Candidatus Wallbacteria bacterium GWC2_49_35]|uniref:Two-component system response regulator n=1 Tax=Candidatus Wallbacteria bacterium GWC2_49_35 TaxID=1817813 RepID=A0A1F7WRC2_9BACT|nr:MAG: two-component system response regulator [Candidatus Wallbacteria bacterium GWC2_49_35]HBC75328.1 two-component system response regulator [Candidatus Wallbacteria bacterium]
MASRILIVDDALIMRMMLKDILTISGGYEICGEAADGFEAIEKFKELKPDLVTMDIIMPKCTGIEALKEIIKIDKNARVIVITAIDQREALMDAIKSGAKDFIVKPFDEERVVSAVSKALKH